MKIRNSISISFFVIISACWLGCATMSIGQSSARLADKIAYPAGFKKQYIQTTHFQLMTYQRLKEFPLSIRVYIEGDGKAWKTKYRISDDPTPINPVALRLAALDSLDNVVYMARPGQYLSLESEQYSSKYWAERRFSVEVVDTVNEALDILKAKYGNKTFDLVGFSGGGALAVLVAARRDDVIALRTVAGNLDIKQWCAYHQVSPLDGSLDPMDVGKQVASIPQRHFVGSRDSIVPFFMAQSFIKALGDKDEKRLTIIPGVTHHEGWKQRWVKLLNEPLR